MRLFLFTLILVLFSFDVSSHETSSTQNHNSPSIDFPFVSDNYVHSDCQDFCCDENDCECGCSIHSFATIEISQVGSQQALKSKNIVIPIPFNFTQYSSTPYRPPIFI